VPAINSGPGLHRTLTTSEYRLAVISSRTGPGSCSWQHSSCVARIRFPASGSLQLDVLAERFPGALQHLDALRGRGPFLYFLDYTNVFGYRETLDIADIFRGGLIRSGDFVMITSCVSPRIVRQPRFLHKYVLAFAASSGRKRSRRISGSAIMSISFLTLGCGGRKLGRSVWEATLCRSPSEYRYRVR